MTVPTDERQAVRRALAPLIDSTPVAPDLNEIRLDGSPARAWPGIRRMRGVAAFATAFFLVLGLGLATFMVLSGEENRAGEAELSPSEDAAENQPAPPTSTGSESVSAESVQIPATGYPDLSDRARPLAAASWDEIALGENRGGPCCIAVGPDGDVFIGDRSRSSILRLTGSGPVDTLAELSGVPVAMTVADNVNLFVLTTDGPTYELEVVSLSDGETRQAPTGIRLPDRSDVDGPIPTLGTPLLAVASDMVFAGEPTPDGVVWRPLATKSGEVLQPDDQVPRSSLPLSSDVVLNVTPTSIALTSGDVGTTTWQLPSGINVDMIRPGLTGVHIAARTAWDESGATDNLILYLGADGRFDGRRFPGSRWAEGGMWHDRAIGADRGLIDLRTTAGGMEVVAYPPIPITGPEPVYSSVEAAQVPRSLLRELAHDGITWQVSEYGSPEGVCLEITATGQSGPAVTDEICNLYRGPSADTFDFASFQGVVDGRTYVVFTGRVGTNVAVVRVHLDPVITSEAENGVWLAITDSDLPETALVEALDQDGNTLSGEPVPLISDHP